MRQIGILLMLIGAAASFFLSVTLSLTGQTFSASMTLILSVVFVAHAIFAEWE